MHLPDDPLITAVAERFGLGPASFGADGSVLLRPPGADEPTLHVGPAGAWLSFGREDDCAVAVQPRKEALNPNLIVPTGDITLDGVAACFGEPLEVMASLTEPVRKLLVTAVGDYGLRFDGRVVLPLRRFESVPAVEAAMTAGRKLIRCLPSDSTAAQRAARVATSDPSDRVRLRARNVILETPTDTPGRAAALRMVLDSAPPSDPDGDWLERLLTTEPELAEGTARLALSRAVKVLPPDRIERLTDRVFEAGGVAAVMAVTADAAPELAARYAERAITAWQSLDQASLERAVDAVLQPSVVSEAHVDALVAIFRTRRRLPQRQRVLEAALSVMTADQARRHWRTNLPLSAVAAHASYEVLEVLLARLRPRRLRRLLALVGARREPWPTPSTTLSELAEDDSVAPTTRAQAAGLLSRVAEPAWRIRLATELANRADGRMDEIAPIVWNDASLAVDVAQSLGGLLRRLFVSSVLQHGPATTAARLVPTLRKVDLRASFQHLQQRQLAEEPELIDQAGSHFLHTLEPDMVAVAASVLVPHAEVETRARWASTLAGPALVAVCRGLEEAGETSDAVCDALIDRPFEPGQDRDAARAMLRVLAAANRLPPADARIVLDEAYGKTESVTFERRVTELLDAGGVSARTLAWLARTPLPPWLLGRIGDLLGPNHASLVEPGLLAQLGADPSREILITILACLEEFGTPDALPAIDELREGFLRAAVIKSAADAASLAIHARHRVGALSLPAGGDGNLSLADGGDLSLID